MGLCPNNPLQVEAIIKLNAFTPHLLEHHMLSLAYLKHVQNVWAKSSNAKLLL